MDKKSWKKYLDTAQAYSGECAFALERLGMEEFTALQNKVQQLFSGHDQMTDMEWVVAASRYQDALADRSFGTRDLDSLMRWAFVLLWWRDRQTEQLQKLVIMSDTETINDPRFGALVKGQAKIDGMQKMCRSIKSDLQACRDAVVRRCDEAIRKDVRGEFKGVVKSMEGFADMIGEEGTLWESMYAQLSDTLSTMPVVDPQQAAFAQKALKETEDKIAFIEEELQLKVQHDKDSPATYLTGVLDKVQRYMVDHPQEYMWHCPVCDWEGQLLKKRPVEDSLVNTLDLCWMWKCPGCNAIIALDRKHPLFDGKVLFNHRLWELVCKGVMSLVDAAYILETAPEYITWAAQEIYKQEIPSHVAKELEEYEKRGIVEDIDELE